MPWWMIVLLLVGAAALAYMAYLKEKRRREDLRRLADQLGWSFDPSKDSSHDERYAHFEIFRRGHSRVAFNTLSGAVEIDGRDYPAQMGDFRYKVTHSDGKGSRTTTYKFSYLIMHMPFPHAPSLLIRREGIFDKLAGAIGFDDIDFESEEFSRAFHVKSSDKRFAYDVVHPRMMEFLLERRPPTIDIEYGRCCIAGGSKRWEPVEFRRWLRCGRDFFDRWPEFLTRQLDETGPDRGARHDES